MNVAETIKSNTRRHLEQGGLFYGQCVSAVGWIGGTVPEMTEEEGIVELPTSDSSNSGIVCGAAVAGRRPIYAIRYQGFMSYNATSILNYAAKSKEMWKKPCPVFVRAIGMEGSIGPVATGMHHSMVMRMPGTIVACPMTPSEWQDVWDFFLENDDPVYCSEHRKSFGIDYNIEDMHVNKWVNISPNCGYFTRSTDKPKVTIFAIGAARLEALKACEIFKNYHRHINFHFVNVVWLKPLRLPEEAIRHLTESDFGIVIDSDYEICGASEHIANYLMLKSKKPVYTLGLEDRTAGFADHCDNKTPSSERIVKHIMER
tara:strand:+ start:26542 stop:27489 length:948 start_codon:yes stop_codon:yes gene_type:complete